MRGERGGRGGGEDGTLVVNVVEDGLEAVEPLVRAQLVGREACVLQLELVVLRQPREHRRVGGRRGDCRERLEDSVRQLGELMREAVDLRPYAIAGDGRRR